MDAALGLLNLCGSLMMTMERMAVTRMKAKKKKEEEAWCWWSEEEDEDAVVLFH